MYWNSNKEWWFYNKETKQIEPTEKAPPEAVESLKKWNEPVKKEKFLKWLMKAITCCTKKAVPAAEA